MPNDFMDPNTWGELPDMERVYLGPYANFYALIDRRDAPWVARSLWHLAQESNPRCWYARRTERVDGVGRTVYLHREVLTRYCMPATPQHVYGDHGNGDTLDDRLANLTWATPKENASNRNQYPVWRAAYVYGVHDA